LTCNGEREFVINENRKSPGYYPGACDSITKKAGLKKIPRLFDNMRASRATEVYAEFGEKLEAAWFGHSKKVALKNYVMVRNGDYARAAKLELTEHTFQ